MRSYFLYFTIFLCLQSGALLAQTGQKVNMGIHSLMVYEWNPGNQALGRFVEKCVKDWQKQANPTGFIIFIGYDDSHYWSLEGGLENDAEDFPFFAQLAETTPEGKRTIHSLPPHKFKGNAPDALMKQVWDWDKIGLLPKTETLKKVAWKKGEDFDSVAAIIGLSGGKQLSYQLKTITHQGTCANDFRWETKIHSAGN